MKPPSGTSAGRNRSRDVLLTCMSVSLTVTEKSRGEKVWRGRIRRKRRRRRITTHFWPFVHHCKTAVTWLYATVLTSICSYCRGQHAYVNIWSIPVFFRFSGVAKISALIAILKTPSGSIYFNSWLRCYRSSGSPVKGQEQRRKT